MLIVISVIFAIAFLIGVPIAFSFGLAGAVYLLFWEGLPASLLVRRIYFVLDSFPLLAVPLFIMIGHLSERAGLIPSLLEWLQLLVGWMKGGIAYINVLASMLFAGVSGTAVSDVASLGRIEIQMMRRSGYDLSFCCALTAASSIVGPIVPPSVAMIIYALAAGNISIGGLFLAGAIPGFLLGGALLVYAYFMTRGREPVERSIAKPIDLVTNTLSVLPLLGLPLIIIGGVVGGFVTVTESAAIGVIYVLVIGFGLTRELQLADIYDAFVHSAKTSSILAMLMGAGAIVSWILIRNQATAQLAEFMAGISSDPTVFMLGVLGTLLVVGMVMEATAVIIALAPLLAPVALGYGIHELQFGLVFCMTVLLGMITPPVGVVLFLTASVGETSIEKLSRAIIPCILIVAVVIVAVVFFPSLTLWLPGLFGL